MTTARRRRDVIGVIASLLVIAATSGLIVRINAGQASTVGRPVDPVEIVASDATMLLQFRDDSGDAVGTLLIGGGSSAAILALPPTLLIPTPQPVTLASAPGERDTLAARNGVSALLGVRVDAVLTLDRLALAGLVDAVGGAPLDVPERVVERGPDGAVRRSIFPGARVLPGTSAAAYAMTRMDAEPESARMQRLAAVTGQVLAALPTDADALRALVVSLGASTRSSVGADETAATLARIRAAVDGGVRVAALPVTVLVGDVASMPREPEASAVVRSSFPHALLAAGQAPLPRIVIRRAGADQRAVLAVREALVDAGMAVVAVQPSGQAGSAARSLVLVPDGSGAAMARGIEVATLAGLPATAVQVDPAPPALPQPDALVVLGADANSRDIG